MGRGPKPTKGKAKPAVSRQSPKHQDDARVRDLEKRLAEAVGRLQTRDRELGEAREQLTAAHAQVTEALDQQTATSDILRVISQSPTDVQPVFDAIVESATRLCAGTGCALFTTDGERIYLRAAPLPRDPEGTERRRQLERGRPLDRASLAGCAILDGAPLHVPDTEIPGAAPAWAAANARVIGFRSALVMPMRHEGHVIGVIFVTKERPIAFNPQQIALLETFAEQAVIAIENVRLFTELQASNRELTTALDTQTATSDILRVISRSQTDVQPVFDSIARHAVTLCDARFCIVYRVDDDMTLHLAAHANFPADALALAQATLPRPATQVSHIGRAIRERSVVNLADVAGTGEAPLHSHRQLARLTGYRGFMAVPMVRDDRVVGCIALGRVEATPFPSEQVALIMTFAEQAVIAIENVRLFTELQRSNRELTAALDTQTATSDILRVISESRTDVQPVFDAIVASAVRLLRGYFAALTRVVGDQIELAATTSSAGAEHPAVRTAFPQSVHNSESVHAQAIRQRGPVNVADAQTDPAIPEALRAVARARGFRSLVAVPLLHQREALGTIAVARREPGGFTDDEIGLLKTFADQAVIAIENVRLFTELQEKNRALTETLEQQTATADILQVISRSPTEVEPVFEAVVTSAARLCEAHDVAMLLVDGDDLRLVAGVGPLYMSIPPDFRIRLTRESAATRAVVDRATVHIHDFAAEPEDEYPVGRELARRFGHRSMLAVPLLREGVPIGVVCAFRLEVRPFPDQQVALLRTFADQAVIAIENARLFKELEQKNEALTQANGQVTEALEQQTATSEILRVISSSPTDIQPVFDTIVRNAVRLCGAIYGTAYTIDRDVIDLVAHMDLSGAGWERFRMTFPRPLRDGGVLREVFESRRLLYLPNVDEYPFSEAARAMLAATNVRSLLTVPMIQHDRVVGAVSLSNQAENGFSDARIALVQTFADQAVIAIENVRLFKALQTRTAELTRSVDELTALGDVGRALSSTLNLEAVLQTIVTRATQLTQMAGCVIWEYDKPRDEFRLRVSHYADNIDATIPPALGGVTTIPRGQGLTTQVVEERQAVQIPDITIEGAYESPVRRPLVDAGHRALLGVPLVSEDEVIGVLAVTRKTPGLFEPETVRLLSTFATQSALAIQNARLFVDIEDKSRQLEVASQHKSEFLANMSHELRTPLNAIIGFSEVLSERMFGDLNEKQEEYLKDIHASGQHLLSLINDILDLSKIEAGKMELELSDFDLPMTIDNALMLVRERATRRGIELHRTVDERLGQVQADERKIRQVLLNLLSNAIKFTPEGGRIAVHAIPGDGMVEVSVSDTGIGIAPEDQEAVFEEFRQVGTAEKKVDGTGLGLALSRKFIELHGGKIWVRSEVGAGSTFTFTVPVRRGLLGEAHQRQAEASVGPQPSTRNYPGSGT